MRKPKDGTYGLQNTSHTRSVIPSNRYTVKQLYANKFTLIELLVVIAIISILASLLLPSLSNARKMARQAHCISKMKQFGSAHEMYMMDWNGYISMNGTSSSVNWYQGLCPYIEGGKEWNAYMAPLYDPSGNWSCPENPSGKGDYNDGSVPAWGGSRALTDNNYYPRKHNEFKKPWGKVYILEANYQHIQYAQFCPVEIGGRLRMRHFRQCNVLFLDGHVKSYRAPPLTSVSSAQASVAGPWIDKNYEPPVGL